MSGGRGPAGDGRGRWRRAGWLLAVPFLAVVVLACEPTLQQATGIVMRVDSPSLGQVDRFELLTLDGELLTFDTSSLEFRPEFPAPHLSEHQVSGDHIVVTYKREGDRLVVTRLDDRYH